MTTHVLSDAAIGYFNGSNVTFANDSRVYQEIFCTIYNFLNGINTNVLIASYYGAAASNAYLTVTGTGLGTWDTATSAGTNAWVLFRFNSATLPFYVLLQWTGLSVALAATGGAATSATSFTQGVCISFAYRTDGLSPWLGTTNANGADTKGSPVWRAGSYIFPRSNSINGTDVSTASRMFSLTSNNNYTFAHTPHIRLCACADENNLSVIIDYLGYYSGISTSREAFPSIVHFGKFTPFNDLNYVSGSGYFALADGSIATTVLSNWGVNYVFGSKTYSANVGSGVTNEGGIAHPAMGSGTIGYSFNTPGFNQVQSVFSNPGMEFLTITNTTTGSMNEAPMLLMANEISSISGSLGPLGYSSWLRMTYGVMPYTTFNGKSRIAIGPYPLTKLKYTIPWSSSAISPGTNVSRIPVIT